MVAEGIHMRHLALAALLCAVAGPASAEIVSQSADAFSLSYERRVHTYSGSAANITVDLRPGGCWCEALPGGGVKHAEAVLVWPERRMVRFDAPFGPLQDLGADAVLTMSWADAEDGGRLLKWTFVVNGPGAGAMAGPVDGVMAEQFGRLAAHLSAQ
jgi:hypothetical protein